MSPADRAALLREIATLDMPRLIGWGAAMSACELVPGEKEAIDARRRLLKAGAA